MRFIQDRVPPPSNREIAEACGLASTSSVSHVLTKLERLGYIERIPDIARGIVVKERI
jgi:repressor LexA